MTSREEKLMMKKIQDNCWSDILEEVRKDGIRCLGRKIEHKGTEASRLRSWRSQRKEEGVTGQGSEGMLLKDHPKESPRITFQFLSLPEPFGEAWGRLVSHGFIEGSCGVSDCERL